ncbi:MAG: hypothetical protein KDA37_06910 [Planctomycetales bacterium]|nr:hypothetical protein [Planctomycetales bacterium]
MLVAMALTLLMMSAVIAVLASVSESVSERRAAIEMGASLRHARSLLQEDLANHTCPALTWTRPESNHGYIEIVEGPQCDFDPSIWLRDEVDNDSPANRTPDGLPDPIGPANLTLDLAVSQLPSSNLFRLPGGSIDVRNGGAVTDGGALGDWDDVLMLTVRNDNKPFVGRVPEGWPADSSNFAAWGATEVESPLAEVIWFAVENPVEENKSFYFGEPGFRTVYRRTMLILPGLQPGFNINGVITGPGVLRVLGDSVDQSEADQAAAALISFQEEYDISVRLEWDPLLGNDGRWVVKANTLGDLTKRESRFEHTRPEPTTTAGGAAILRPVYPYRAVSSGAGIGAVALSLERGAGLEQRNFDASDVGAVNVAAATDAAGASVSSGDGRNAADAYRVSQRGGRYPNRPFVYADRNATSAPTARAVVNELGQVVMFSNGMVPLSGSRRGEDVVLSNMLAFDVRVFDPHAPLLAEIADTTEANYPGEVVDPSSAAWGVIASAYYRNGVLSDPDLQPIISRGAYVDLSYFDLHAYFAARNPSVPGIARSSPSVAGWQQLIGDSRFAEIMDPKSMGDKTLYVTSDYFFQPYRAYDTWSTHYENNGVNDDHDGVDRNNNGSLDLGEEMVDEGTNGFDDRDPTIAGRPNLVDHANDIAAYGVDDPSERETAPPYDTPLRGIQITLRAYEPDSRQVREVNVKQTFVPK